MTMVGEVIPKPLFRVITTLTHQRRIDVALSIAVKDWIRLRLTEVAEEQRAFEHKYGMSFEEFKEKWHADLIPNRYSHETEKDYWEWEGAVSNELTLREMAESLL